MNYFNTTDESIFRIFKGSATRQVHDVTGEPAMTEAWYFEPVDHDDDRLFSRGYSSAAKAAEAAEILLTAGYVADCSADTIDLDNQDLVRVAQYLF